MRLRRLQHFISRKDCGQDTFVVLVKYIQQIASSCNSGILLSALPSSLDWALAGNCQKLSETTTKVGHPTQKSSQIISFNVTCANFYRLAQFHLKGKMSWAHTGADVAAEAKSPQSSGNKRTINSRGRIYHQHPSMF